MTWITRAGALALLGTASVWSSSCEDAAGRARSALDRTDSALLRADAALLYKNVFSGRKPAFTLIPPSSWPESFRPLAPMHIGAREDGFSVALEVRGDAESGLYIVPLHMEHAPASSPGAKFQRLREGIYWYAFGG